MEDEKTIDPDIDKFKDLVRTHYRRYGRRFPWRETRDPYEITVSEFMLQQTGTGRVEKKYPPFLLALPTFAALAAADLREVLRLWQGLGYNRRALALRRTAELVVTDFGGILPDDPEILVKLPGIGPGTAGSLSAFVYDLPAVFIETNIRRVFLHFFFEGRDRVRDAEILPLIESSLDRESPRDWYYGLMDYGVYLKDLYPNPNRRSAHYTRQSRFEGSHRQVRGRILALLTGNGLYNSVGAEDLAARTGFSQEFVKAAVEELAAEGFVAETEGLYRIAGRGPQEK